jgi:hypothetical protein
LASAPQFLRATLAIGAFVIAVGAVTSALVVRAAQKIAGAEPYCIQVADGRADYRPARSWLDLSVWTMWAMRESALFMQHHAILVAGDAANPRLSHWSYRQLAFVPGVRNGEIEGHGPTVTCIPARDFAHARLALLAGTSPDSNYIKYSGRETYLIPSMWQAEWSGGTNPTLRFAVTAPDFRPLARPWSDLAPSERDSNQVVIDWNTKWLLSLMTSRLGSDVVEQGSEYGLAKTKADVGYRYMIDADGSPEGSRINTTMIDCGMPSEAVPKSCQHRFINTGRHLYFRHRPEDLANWQDMQRRILDLMDSFEIREGRP